VALLRKLTCILRHPLGLRHSVVFVCYYMSLICTLLFDKNRSVLHESTVELIFVKFDFGQILVKTNSHASRARASCVLQCVAVRWSVLQCVAVCCSVLHKTNSHASCTRASCVLQCVAVRWSVLQCVNLHLRWQGMPQNSEFTAFMRHLGLPLKKKKFFFSSSYAPVQRPVVCVFHTILTLQRPVLSPKRPIFRQKRPVITQKRPIFTQFNTAETCVKTKETYFHTKETRETCNHTTEPYSHTRQTKGIYILERKEYIF